MPEIVSLIDVVEDKGWPVDWREEDNEAIAARIAVTVWPDQPWRFKDLAGETFEALFEKPIVLSTWLQKNLDPNASWPTERSGWAWLTQESRRSLAFKTHRPALLYAIADGNLDVVRLLLQHGANVPDDWRLVLLRRPCSGNSQKQKLWPIVSTLIDDAVSSHEVGLDDAQAWRQALWAWLPDAKSMRPFDWVAERINLDVNAPIERPGKPSETLLSAMLKLDSPRWLGEMLERGATWHDPQTSPWGVYVAQRDPSDGNATQKALEVAELLMQHDVSMEGAPTALSPDQQRWWDNKLQPAVRLGRTPSAWWAMIDRHRVEHDQTDRFEAWMADAPSTMLWQSNQKSAWDRVLQYAKKDESALSEKETGPWDAWLVCLLTAQENQPVFRRSGLRGAIAALLPFPRLAKIGFAALSKKRQQEVLWSFIEEDSPEALKVLLTLRDWPSILPSLGGGKDEWVALALANGSHRCALVGLEAGLVSPAEYPRLLAFAEEEGAPRLGGSSIDVQTVIVWLAGKILREHQARQAQEMPEDPTIKVRKPRL